MNVAPNTDCEGCKQQIGNENFVVCWDGIASKHVTFHKRCDPNDKDLRRHFGMSLEPININADGTGLS